ncbi:PH domain-containing protein [Brevifollis gellanilyticus]|nr:PH domain-containing protein [Brevifollis gellanilyticus]
MSASTVFPMIPAASKSLWFFAIIGLVLLGALLLMGWLAWSMQHARFTVSSEGLRVQGDLYSRTIPLKSLVLDQATVTNLNTDKDHQPKWRTMGTGLPGYSAGWFKLRNGQKGLLYVTDRTRVARIPTTEGYTVLLSVEDPQALISALQAQRSPL